MNSTTDIIGALPPPPGVTPNFVDPDYNGLQIIISGIIFSILAISFLVARMYAKYYLLKQFNYDDCKPFPLKLKSKGLS